MAPTGDALRIFTFICACEKLNNRKYDNSSYFAKTQMKSFQIKVELNKFLKYGIYSNFILRRDIIFAHNVDAS